MPKEVPEIPQEMPPTTDVPEVQEPNIPESPQLPPDEAPLNVPDESPMPDIPEELPPAPKENQIG